MANTWISRATGEKRMYIKKVVIQNYRCLRNSQVALNPRLNILVGDNECGKSTLLEAINLALTGQLNGRSLLQELHPHLVNRDAVNKYVTALKAGKPAPPPGISIELFFGDDTELAQFKGINNSDKADTYGVKLSIEYHDSFATDYAAYIKDPMAVRTVPIEYYRAAWTGFDGNTCYPRDILIHPKLIDASQISGNVYATRYLVNAVKETLDKPEQIDVGLAYRLMKEAFGDDPRVKKINDGLAAKKDPVTNKVLSIALDTTARGGWDSGIMPMLDDIPLPLVGKGEQNSVNLRIAMEKAKSSHIFLIEEPESHQSPTNLARLIGQIDEKRGDRQVLAVTHSSFVLNKLGIEGVHLFHNGKSTTLAGLSADTQKYFKKLPGYDTLRLVLARKAILVEGPSDELIVQRAYKQLKGKTSMEDGVDVIEVGSLAFRRFLEIAAILGNPVAVVTDNDGDVKALEEKYAAFKGVANINICYSDDESRKTLEPQLVASTGAEIVEKILGREFDNEGALIAWMTKSANKTDCALKFFETNIDWKVPEYIARAIG